MHNLQEQLLVIISTPIYIIIIGVEILLSQLHQKKLYSTKDTATNIYLMILNATVDVLFRIIYLQIFQFFFNHAVMQWNKGIWYWIIL